MCVFIIDKTESKSPKSELNPEFIILKSQSPKWETHNFKAHNLTNLALLTAMQVKLNFQIHPGLPIINGVQQEDENISMVKKGEENKEQ